MSNFKYSPMRCLAIVIGMGVALAGCASPPQSQANFVCKNDADQHYDDFFHNHPSADPLCLQTLVTEFASQSGLAPPHDTVGAAARSNNPPANQNAVAARRPAGNAAAQDDVDLPIGVQIAPGAQEMEAAAQPPPPPAQKPQTPEAPPAILAQARPPAPPPAEALPPDAVASAADSAAAANSSAKAAAASATAAGSSAKAAAASAKAATTPAPSTLAQAYMTRMYHQSIAYCLYYKNVNGNLANIVGTDFNLADVLVAAAAPIAAFAAGANASITALVGGVVGIFGSQFKTALNVGSQNSSSDFSQTQTLMASIYSLMSTSPVLTASPAGADAKPGVYYYSPNDALDALSVFQIGMTQACFSSIAVSAAAQSSPASTTGNTKGQTNGAGSAKQDSDS